MLVLAIESGFCKSNKYSEVLPHHSSNYVMLLMILGIN